MKNHICDEVFAVTRACERLLSTDVKLTENERSLLEYYIQELSREFFSDNPTVRIRVAESQKPAATYEAQGLPRQQ